MMTTGEIYYSSTARYCPTCKRRVNRMSPAVRDGADSDFDCAVCGTCTECTAGELRRGRFQICDSPPFDGWTRDENWNGWACPFFEKAAADAYVVWLNSTGDYGERARYEDTEDAYLIPTGDRDEPFDRFASVVLSDGTKVYPIGTFGYTWEDVTEEDGAESAKAGV